METMKKQFVAPSLTVEASLEEVTLISGGHGKHKGKNKDHNNNGHNNHNNGHRGS